MMMMSMMMMMMTVRIGRGGVVAVTTLTACPLKLVHELVSPAPVSALPPHEPAILSSRLSDHHNRQLLSMLPSQRLLKARDLHVIATAMVAIVKLRTTPTITLMTTLLL